MRIAGLGSEDLSTGAAACVGGGEVAAPPRDGARGLEIGVDHLGSAIHEREDPERLDRTHGVERRDGFTRAGLGHNVSIEVIAARREAREQDGAATRIEGPWLIARAAFEGECRIDRAGTQRTGKKCAEGRAGEAKMRAWVARP